MALITYLFVFLVLFKSKCTNNQYIYLYTKSLNKKHKVIEWENNFLYNIQRYNGNYIFIFGYLDHMYPVNQMFRDRFDFWPKDIWIGWRVIRSKLRLNVWRFSYRANFWFFPDILGIFVPISEKKRDCHNVMIITNSNKSIK